MSGWQDRVEELLYESESVSEVLDIDSSRVVVTSHRVLTFTPEMDGENFQQVERPNVTGVETSAQGRTALAGRSIRYGVYGLVLVLAGVFIDFEALIGDVSFDSEATSQTGASGIVSIADAMLNGMTQIDELMQVVGALVLLVAVAMFAVYWLLRVPTLAIRVAGDGGDIHVQRPEDVDDAIRRLESAILPESEIGGRSEGFASRLPNDLF
ncbi:MAG: hypothetical protein ACOCY1_01665 [Halovenus sp.]